VARVKAGGRISIGPVGRSRAPMFKPKTERSVGQPLQYNAKIFRKTCAFLASRGATIAEMADACGVATRTFYRWMNEYPDLNEAVTSGKEAFDTRVERALAERAVGYSVDVEEFFVVKGKLLSQIVRNYYPPDVTACIYWTKNRMPDRWRDVQRHEVNAVGLKSAEELRQLLAAEFQDLVDQGLLKLPAPERKMKEINPKNNGHGDT
jgi:hypothetical protein